MLVLIDPKKSYQYMSRAIELAEKGLFSTDPNPRVGCVVVNNGTVVGEGYHVEAGSPHAEVHALKQAGKSSKGSDVYVTLEPCCHAGKTPPCSKALINAEINRVFVACLDPNDLVAGKGVKELEQAGIKVYVGLLDEEAKELNKGFFKRMRCNLPWVRLKMAMSLDGKTAMKDGESKWITGAEARKDVQSLRARSSAILTGINTVLADDPSMNVRLNEADSKHRKIKNPLVVVLDSKGQLKGSEKLFSCNDNILVYTKNSVLHGKLKAVSNIEIVVPEGKNNQLSLPIVLEDLAKRGVNELHVECGSTLAGAFINEQLCDEIIVYMAPKIMGHEAMPLFNLPIQNLTQSIPLIFNKIEHLGKDIKITLQAG